MELMVQINGAVGEYQRAVLSKDETIHILSASEISRLLNHLDALTLKKRPDMVQLLRDWRGVLPERAVTQIDALLAKM